MSPKIIVENFAKATELRQAICDMFADARDCVSHERAALVEWKTGDEQNGRCIFDCICSMPDSSKVFPYQEPKRHYIKYDTVDAQIAEALNVVKDMFPEARDQRVLFRAGPEFEWSSLGLHPTLWLRLGSVPLDVNEFVVRD